MERSPHFFVNQTIHRKIHFIVTFTFTSSLPGGPFASDFSTEASMRFIPPPYVPRASPTV